MLVFSYQYFILFLLMLGGSDNDGVLWWMAFLYLVKYVDCFVENVVV